MLRDLAVKKYKKKPVVIYAIQLTRENLDDVSMWIFGTTVPPVINAVCAMIIPTLEGNHQAQLGDWIIKGIKGEFYPCKSDIFELTYEEV